MRVRFLGTGAGGGTPGFGRSERCESWLLVEGHANVLIDVPAHVDEQLGDVATLDAEIGRSAPAHEILEQAVAEVLEGGSRLEWAPVELAGFQRNSRCDR
jgi:hypothetical protein